MSSIQELRNLVNQTKEAMCQLEIDLKSLEIDLKEAMGKIRNNLQTVKQINEETQEGDKFRNLGSSFSENLFC